MRTLFRFSSEGRLVVRVRVGIGGLFCVRDCPCAAVDDSVAAFPGQVGDTNRSQPSAPDQSARAQLTQPRSAAEPSKVSCFPQKTTGKQLGRAYSASWLVIYRVLASIGGVLKIARDWHAHYAPIFMLGRAADEAIRPALVSALADAEAEVARLEAESGAALPADSKQKLAVAHALDALDDHEAANGWLGMSPEAVEILYTPWFWAARVRLAGGLTTRHGTHDG